MYKVKRAIIMAAGKGDRMRPVTADIPKPLVSVNGIRMIDSVIDALHKNGIEDIVIVTGYLAHCFDTVKAEHPEIRLINNPYYDSCNNVSSLYCAREFLDTDVMILDGDQLIYNPDILDPYFERSGYNAVEVSGPTDEWLLTVEDNIVVSCSVGGNSGWQLYSVSRWTSSDALRLKKDLELEFEEKSNRDIYWDDIPVFIHKDEFCLGIRKMDAADIVEIDSFSELVNTDKSYQEYGITVQAKEG